MSCNGSGHGATYIDHKGNRMCMICGEDLKYIDSEASPKTEDRQVSKGGNSNNSEVTKIFGNRG